MISLDLKQEGGVRCLTVGGEAMLEHAGELKKKLLELLRSGRQLEIRLQDLQRIDISALQLICAAHRQAVSQNKTLKLCPAAVGDFQSVCCRSGLVRSRGCRFDVQASCVWMVRNQSPA